MQNQNLNNKNHIHFGHLGAVLLVAVFLLGVSWMKNPQLFKMFSKRTNASSASLKIPQYYAYQTPAELNQPLVAGASTNPNVPMIINEDGSLSPAVDLGEVLGLNTEISLDLQSIKIKTISHTEENASNYLTNSRIIEDNYLNNYEFESALSSQNKQLVDAQVEKIKSIINALLELQVPVSLADIHKLKILQYQASVEMLLNLLHDDNPELTLIAMARFLKSQDDLEIEIKKAKEDYGLDYYAF